MSKKTLIKEDENYISRRTTHGVQQFPTKKKKRELMQASGEYWYLEFLEPETRSRLGK